jgi:anti-anti-sigma factor
MTPSLLTIKTPEWDLASCEEFFAELTPALEPAQAVVDLSQVTYIDSSCLRMIVRLQKERELRGLSPASFLLSPQVRKLFAILSFQKIWTIHSDRDEVERGMSAVDRRKAVNRSTHLAS